MFVSVVLKAAKYTDWNGWLKHLEPHDVSCHQKCASSRAHFPQAYVPVPHTNIFPLKIPQFLQPPVQVETLLVLSAVAAGDFLWWPLTSSSLTVVFCKTSPQLLCSVSSHFSSLFKLTSNAWCCYVQLLVNILRQQTWTGLHWPPCVIHVGDGMMVKMLVLFPLWRIHSKEPMFSVNELNWKDLFEFRWIRFIGPFPVDQSTDRNHSLTTKLTLKQQRSN